MNANAIKTCAAGIMVMAATALGAPQMAQAKDKCALTIQVTNKGSRAFTVTKIRYRIAGEKGIVVSERNEKLAKDKSTSTHRRAIKGKSCKETFFFTISALCRRDGKNYSRMFKFKRKGAGKKLNVNLKINGKNHKWKNCRD